MSTVTQTQFQSAIEQQYAGIRAVNVGWSDLSSPLVGAKIDVGSGSLDPDFYNGGIIFEASARYPDDPAMFNIQYNHQYLLGAGAVFRPHFHWLQNQAGVPNMLMLIKLTSNGVPTTFYTDYSGYDKYAWTGSVWTWSSGCLPNITKFPEYDLSSLGISGMLDVLFFRDYTNVSGLFAGTDPVAGPVTVKFYDGHVKMDQERGSPQEYNKDQP